MKLELSPLGAEALDSPKCDPLIARATLNDITTCNTLFGGRAAAVYGVRQLLAQANARAPITLLDLGAGSGDVVRHITTASRSHGGSIRGVALDWHVEAVRLCRESGVAAVRGDVAALPIRHGSVDVIVASQLLHHFSRRVAGELVASFALLARIGVVIADLRRARLAMWGVRIASHALNFHPVTRHDGVLSVQRGFSTREFTELFRHAKVNAAVYRRPGYRLVAVCRTKHAYH